jgi:hypothetical protein
MTTLLELMTEIGTTIGVFINSLAPGAVIFLIALAIIMGFMAVFGLITFAINKVVNG